MGQARWQTEGQRQSKTEGEVNCGHLQAWGSVLVQVYVARPLSAGVDEAGHDKRRGRPKQPTKQSLAKGEVEIRETRPVATPKEFCDTPWSAWSLGRRPLSSILARTIRFGFVPGYAD